MSWQSRVPTAILGLISALNAEPSLSTVSVLDGPEVTAKAVEEAITVGFTTEERPEAVSANLAVEGMSNIPNRERFSINCGIHVLRGKTDVAAARARAYELLSSVGQALAADKTLGRTVLQCNIGDHVLSQVQGPKGVLAEIIFAVDCDAYTVR